MFAGIGGDARPTGITLVTDAFVVRGTIETRHRRITDMLNSAEHEFLVLANATFDEFGSTGQAIQADYAHARLDDARDLIDRRRRRGHYQENSLHTLRAQERQKVLLPLAVVVGIHGNQRVVPRQRRRFRGLDAGEDDAVVSVAVFRIRGAHRAATARDQMAPARQAPCQRQRLAGEQAPVAGRVQIGTGRRGAGRIFYSRPGHETYPTFHDRNVLKVIENAVRWAAPTPPPGPR